MANVKDLNRKINSLKNMQKVMRAMNMIASIKLRKLLRFQNPLHVFSDSIETLTQTLTGYCRDSESPIIGGFKNIKQSHIILFSADKGLCGAHNTSVKKTVDHLMAGNRDAGINTDFTCIGSKGALFCRQKGYQISMQSDIHEKIFSLNSLKQITSGIFKRFMQGEIHSVTAVYNKFLSTISQQTTVIPLLPVPAIEEAGQKKGGFTGYSEPEKDIFLTQAAELYLYYNLQAALLHSRISEQAARMTAMENATNNSEDLIHRYGRARNRVRQATITNELIEIISGKEAMKR